MFDWSSDDSECIQCACFLFRGLKPRIAGLLKPPADKKLLYFFENFFIKVETTGSKNRNKPIKISIYIRPITIKNFRN